MIKIPFSPDFIMLAAKSNKILAQAYGDCSPTISLSADDISAQLSQNHPHADAIKNDLNRASISTKGKKISHSIDVNQFDAHSIPLPARLSEMSKAAWDTEDGALLSEEETRAISALVITINENNKVTYTQAGFFRSPYGVIVAWLMNGGLQMGGWHGVNNSRDYSLEIARQSKSTQLETAAVNENTLLFTFDTCAASALVLKNKFTSNQSEETKTLPEGQHNPLIALEYRFSVDGLANGEFRATTDDHHKFELEESVFNVLRDNVKDFISLYSSGKLDPAEREYFLFLSVPCLVDKKLTIEFANTLMNQDSKTIKQGLDMIEACYAEPEWRDDRHRIFKTMAEARANHHSNLNDKYLRYAAVVTGAVFLAAVLISLIVIAPPYALVFPFLIAAVLSPIIGGGVGFGIGAALNKLRDTFMKSSDKEIDGLLRRNTTTNTASINSGLAAHKQSAADSKKDHGLTAPQSEKSETRRESVSGISMYDDKQLNKEENKKEETPPNLRK